ncbi:hypothetical protein [uncultured Sneathia sp.]|uniref:hypothetical protein n=1 Tax=uncultured Sneathia sp. TaxID=278067 RepID=UPI0028041BEE|nr:hypothetical protein [uncultured Sneathia sp.]
MNKLAITSIFLTSVLYANVHGNVEAFNNNQYKINSNKFSAKETGINAEVEVLGFKIGTHLVAQDNFTKFTSSNVYAQYTTPAYKGIKGEFRGKASLGAQLELGTKLIYEPVKDLELSFASTFNPGINGKNLEYKNVLTDEGVTIEKDSETKLFAHSYVFEAKYTKDTLKVTGDLLLQHVNERYEKKKPNQVEALEKNIDKLRKTKELLEKNKELREIAKASKEEFEKVNVTEEEANKIKTDYTTKEEELKAKSAEKDKKQKNVDELQNELNELKAQVDANKIAEEVKTLKENQEAISKELDNLKQENAKLTNEKKENEKLKAKKEQEKNSHLDKSKQIKDSISQENKDIETLQNRIDENEKIINIYKSNLKDIEKEQEIYKQIDKIDEKIVKYEKELGDNKELKDLEEFKTYSDLQTIKKIYKSFRKNLDKIKIYTEQINKIDKMIEEYKKEPSKDKKNEIQNIEKAKKIYEQFLSVSKIKEAEKNKKYDEQIRKADKKIKEYEEKLKKVVRQFETYLELQNMKKAKEMYENRLERKDIKKQIESAKNKIEQIKRDLRIKQQELEINQIADRIVLNYINETELTISTIDNKIKELNSKIEENQNEIAKKYKEYDNKFNAITKKTTLKNLNNKPTEKAEIIQNKEAELEAAKTILKKVSDEEKTLKNDFDALSNKKAGIENKQDKKAKFDEDNKNLTDNETELKKEVFTGEIKAEDVEKKLNEVNSEIEEKERNKEEQIKDIKENPYNKMEENTVYIGAKLGVEYAYKNLGVEGKLTLGTAYKSVKKDKEKVESKFMPYAKLNGKINYNFEVKKNIFIVPELSGQVTADKLTTSDLNIKYSLTPKVAFKCTPVNNLLISADLELSNNFEKVQYKESALGTNISIKYMW